MRTTALRLLLIIILVYPVFQLNSEDQTTNYKEIAQYVTHVIAVGLGASLSKIQDEEQRIEFLRNFITPIRFYPDSTGYFYIYSYDNINIAHATQKELQGKDLSNYQDGHGNYVGKISCETAKNGGGFVEFYWQKPNDKTEYKKIGYVEPI
ncbi:MAG TPA: hypothetical protein ENL10_00675, partial [Candidatus Cloacimonetes bacterium]|nr:hypothetical protein [Candidatus Cloacimonadota bacterium]